MSRARLMLALTLVLTPALVHAQGASPDGVWRFTTGPALEAAARLSIERPHVVVTLDRAAFDRALDPAPREAAADVSGGVVFTLPMPSGQFARFRVVETQMLVPELAAAFPTIRTWSGQGIDDPTATTRFGWTDAGFHAIVLSAAGTTYIDPTEGGATDAYVSFDKKSYRRDGAAFTCLVGDARDEAALRTENQFPFSHGSTRRTYRLALAATGEYTQAAGGSKPQALARMVTTMNRVNGIYERELAVRMTLATGTGADPTALIYTDGASDPYTNDDGVAMLAENQANLDNVVGTADYDIGHVFSTGGGGIASLRSPCSASRKAQGVTGSSHPTGDAFDVDYVAHEMGHQFGGNHTFNGSAGSCAGGNRAASHAYEVGSGSTIQGYAGICGVVDLQPNSDDYFHVESLDEMTAFLTSGGGTACGTTAVTGNTPPAVSAGSNYAIPRSTPFTLTASGSDTDGDSLTYAWEEFDLGAAAATVAESIADDGSRPLFRSYAPGSSPARTFPSMAYVLQNANVPPATYTCSGGTCLIGESMPTTDRTMTFQVTARDNRAGGGGVATSSMQATISSVAGPFRVTSPNSPVTVIATSTQAVTWDVAGTAAAPISVADVRISLSTDGGATFPTVLAASTANDGSHDVTFPAVETTTARIKVEAVGSVFFDVSDTNFTVTQPPYALVVTPSDGFTSSGVPTGPFDPASKTYTLRNAGSSPMGWSVTQAVPAGPFVLPVPASGTLAPAATTTVTVSLRTPGSFTYVAGSNYSDTISFSNTTNGVGDTTRLASLTVDVAGLPLAPTNLQAVAAGPSRIDLSWQNNAIDATAVHVQRYYQQGEISGWLPVGETTGSAFSDTSVACGTAYTYQVRAYRSDDDAYSTPSNQASATTNACAYTLNVVGTGIGSGTVTSQPGLVPAIACTVTGGQISGTCSQSYVAGTVVILTATPAAGGSSFTGWSGGGCTGIASCTVTVAAPTTVTASFDTTRALTVIGRGSGSGSVTSQAGLVPAISCTVTLGVAAGTCAQGYANGTTVTLTAAPSAAGHSFTGWSGGGCSGTAPCAVTLTAAATVTATFASAPGNASYNATYWTVACTSTGNVCDSGPLVNGRGQLAGGPEPNQPNTIYNGCADGSSGDYHVDESLDRLRVVSVDGGALRAGQQARIEATVWVYDNVSDYLDLYVTNTPTRPSWTYLTTLHPTVPGSQVVTHTFTLPGGGLQAVRGRYRYQGSVGTCGTGAYDDHDDLVFAVVTEQPSALLPSGDYDGDGRADVGVFRPSNSGWYIKRSSGGNVGISWGAPNDVPVPSDYDGDGRTDLAVFRPTDVGWYIVNSSGAPSRGVQWGSGGDVPVPGDYDGDGRADIAVWRPSDGGWYIVNSSGGSRGVRWGTQGDIPVPADYDGDGRTDVAVFRPSESGWYVLRSRDGATGLRWGTTGDVPVFGDFDGDDQADVAVFRPAEGAWYIIGSTAGGIAHAWGTVGDKPI